MLPMQTFQVIDNLKHRWDPETKQKPTICSRYFTFLAKNPLVVQKIHELEDLIQEFFSLPETCDNEVKY